MPYIKTKQPREVLDYDIDCTKRLSNDDYIVTVNVTIDGPDQNLIYERATPVEDGVRAKLWLSGGTNLMRYKVTVLCTTFQGRIIESEFFVELKDK